MRKTLSILFLLAVALCGQASAQLSQCAITATIYDNNGDLLSGARIVVVKVVKNGSLISNSPLTYTTNASGVATFNLPRSSVAWIWANSYGLNANGSAGVAVTVPNAASANLEELAAFSSVLTTLGDLAYGGASGVFTRLAGNTSTTAKFLCQQGNGTTSTAPGWCAFAGSGNLTLTYDNNARTATFGYSPSSSELLTALGTQSANRVLASPDGSSGTMTVRALVSADLPSHTHALSNLTQSGATSGQVASWNGSAWVPATVASGWGSITGTLSSQTDLQSALDLKANLAGPAFTGNPTAPTQSAGNNSTRIATTAYVDTAVTAVTGPFVDSTAIIKGSADATKLLAFEVDGFTTATTRTLTPQDASYILAGTNLAQTFSGVQTFSSNPIVTNTAPTLAFTDTTASAKSLTIAVDANVADFRESAGASGSLWALDLTNNRIGIGTSSPGFKLHVNDATATNAAGSIKASTSNVSAVIEAAEGTSRFFLSPSAGLEILTSTNHPIAFGANKSGGSSPDMVISTAGNVGIATTSPTVPLEVAGNVLVKKSVSAGGAVAATIQNTHADGEAAFTVRNDLYYTALEVFGSNFSTATLRNVALFTAQSGITQLGFATLGAGSITFRTNTSTGITNDRLFISSGGNIGLNSTAPDTTLDVNIGTTGGFQLSYNDSDGSAANKVVQSVTSSGNYTLVPSGGLATLTGSLNISAGLGLAQRTATASTITVALTDVVIYADPTSASQTANLPTAASACVGGVCKIYYFKKVDSGVNTVTIDGSGSETIDGQLTRVLSVAYEGVKLQSNGSNWYVIGTF